jgi:hypothetical protein
MVVFGRDRVFRLSHADCCCAIAKRTNARVVIMAGASVARTVSEIVSLRQKSQI